MKKIALLVLVLVLLSTAVFVRFVRPVEAIGTITINADGSIFPSDAPINTTDMVTYYFNGNIASDFHGIVIERDNIVVDGASYTIEGTGAYGSIGIYLTDRINVTIKNMEITAFYYGIRLDESSNNTISGNNITNNGDGIYFYETSHNNIISGNNITNNGNYGIALLSSLDNTISENTITNNGHGVYSNSSHNNIISGNNIANHSNCGIWFRYSSNNIFYGNTITNITQWGILGAWGVLLEISSYNNIYGNTIANHRGFGIHLVACSNNIVSGNTVTNNGNDIYGDDDGYGICLASCSNNTITGNTVTNNDYGIYLRYPSCANNTVSRNTVTNNGRGIRLDCSNNTLTGNNITKNGDGITLGSYAHYNDIFANNVTGNTNWGIYLRYSENNTLTGNNITKNDYGFYLKSCSNNTVSGNTVMNNTNGIYLDSSANNTLTGNTVTDNDDGIHFDYGSSNTLTRNSITNNDNGIRIEGYSYWNLIYHNNFIDNTQQVYIPALVPASFWDDGYPSGGNYWDDYEEIDTDGDGIGDTLYDIDANNQDRYPLVVPPVPIPIVLDGMIFPVELKANSTISRFRFDASQRMIRFNVTGEEGTLGFCNLTIPNNLVEDLWQVNFTVLVDGKEPITMNNWTDGTYTYIYFTYLHSTHKVEIIPEFPTWTPMLLLLILLTVGIAIYKRRQLETPIH